MVGHGEGLLWRPRRSYWGAQGEGWGTTRWLAPFHSAEVAVGPGSALPGVLASVGSPHTGCRLRGIGGGGTPIIIAIVTSAPG